MWKATGRIIQDRPLTGVGAGAWESVIPLYQAEGAQLETDYYVHNEFLQLLAEYGLVGWIFLLALFAYLIDAAWRTVRDTSAAAQEEAPYRALLLTGLLALFVVSNVGFPWRMASTGAIFAACLAALAASDARLGLRARWAASALRWKPTYSQAGVICSLSCLALAGYITQQAAKSEEKIVQATKLALTISASGDFNNPRWDPTKAELLRLIKQGTDINPHYRKITPMVADELAKWGDWKNATWIWESVISSRPYVVAIISNVARGYASLGNAAKAREYLERAKKIQPNAPAVRSLEVILLSRMGEEARALELAREAMARNMVDYDLLNAAFVLAWRSGDYAFATEAMLRRNAASRGSTPRGLVQLGNMYATGAKDPAKALAYYREAFAGAPPSAQAALQAEIPAEVWTQLGLGSGALAASQTSVISK
jgi:tetratricopeptide (TPR) repeat protein